MKLFVTLALLCLFAQCSSADVSEFENDRRSLPELINAYRMRQGLSAIPISRALTRVALAHVQDLQRNSGRDDNKCNLHSWSTAGAWSPCCYTDDGSAARCMWNKPREIAGYRGDGFEIGAAAFASQRKDAMTPWFALDRWAHSDGHRAVMLNEERWKPLQWKAMGAALSDNYAVAWFGTEAD